RLCALEGEGVEGPEIPELSVPEEQLQSDRLAARLNDEVDLAVLPESKACFFLLHHEPHHPALIVFLRADNIYIVFENLREEVPGCVEHTRRERPLRWADLKGAREDRLGLGCFHPRRFQNRPIAHQVREDHALPVDMQSLKSSPLSWQR